MVNIILFFAEALFIDDSNQIKTDIDCIKIIICPRSNPNNYSEEIFDVSNT